MQAPHLNSTVERLAPLKFTARQVAEAAGISGDVLTNYLTKERIKLSSRAPGRGRARAYCLADVYQIALLADLVSLTRDAPWSARAIEAFVDEGAFKVHTAGQDLNNTAWAHWRAEKPSRRPDLCADISLAHPLFWSRPLAQNWMIFADAANIEAQFPRLSIIQAGSAQFLGFENRGFHLNATKRLWDVDQALAEIAGKPDLDSAIGKAVDE